ncbi:MAG: oligosaccharide flippase family protein [Candidatus Entotheonellia bacterium]
MLKDRLAKSIFWIVWSRGAVQTVSFIATLGIARLLHPSDYGLMALAVVWTSTITTLSEMGLGAAIIQFRDMEESELSACFWLTMAVAGTGYLALFIGAPVIAEWFATPTLTAVLRTLGLTLPITAVRVVPDSLLRKRLELDKISKAEIASAILSIPVTISLAWGGAGVWALVAGSLVTAVVQSLAMFWFIRWHPTLRVNGGRLKKILHFSFAMLGSRIFWSVYQQSDTIVLGKIAGKVHVGFYSMAMELATLPVVKVSAVINQLAFPVMAELQTDREALRVSFLWVVRLVAWTTFPLCLGMTQVAEDLVHIALTGKWLPAVPIIQVLSIYAMIRSIAVLLPPVLTARYRARFLFGYNLMMLGVMPLVFWAGAAQLGAMGVAVAWVVVYPILLSRMARVALSELDVSWKMLWQQLQPPLLSTVVMLIAMVAVHWSFSLWGSDLALSRPAVISRLVAMTLAGVSVYGLCLWAFGGQVLTEIREVAGWIIWRGRTGTKVPESVAHESVKRHMEATINNGDKRNLYEQGMASQGDDLSSAALLPQRPLPREHPPVSALEAERLKNIQAICPQVETVLEVGAGKGRVTGVLLGQCKRITALDLEAPTWTLPDVHPVKGDVRKLEFPDNSFDLVVCTEVLEHVWPEDLRQACKEILRVSRRYVLVGVPFDQDIRLGRTTCSHCGIKNPPYGHIGQFTQVKLLKAFAPAHVVTLQYVGQTRLKTNLISTALMDFSGNPWGTYDQDEPCIFCKRKLQQPTQMSIVKRLASYTAATLNSFQSHLARRKANWIHVLLEKP